RSTPISDPSSKPHGEDRSEPSTPSASPSRAAPCLAQLENVNGDLSNYHKSARQSDMCLHHNSARKRTSARATLARFAERQSLNPLRHQYVRGPAEPNACPLDERRCGVPHTNSGKRPFEIK